MLISDFVVIIASASWLLCIMAFSWSVFHLCCKHSYHLEAPDAQKVNTLNFNEWQQRINLCVSQYLGTVLILVFLSQRGALQRWVELTGELGLTRSLAVSPALVFQHQCHHNLNNNPPYWHHPIDIKYHSYLILHRLYSIESFVGI